jgi:hypothetical protein
MCVLYFVSDNSYVVDISPGVIVVSGRPTALFAWRDDTRDEMPFRRTDPVSPSEDAKSNDNKSDVLTTLVEK